MEQAAALAADLGHAVEEVALPVDYDELRRIMILIVAANTAETLAPGNFLRPEGASRADVETMTWRFAERGEAITTAEYLRAQAAVRQLGYRPEIIETPGHLFVSLRIAERVIYVETTAPLGFDIDPRIATGGVGPWARATDENGRRLSRSARDEAQVWPVRVDQAAGFAWINSAWKAMEAGRPLEALCLIGLGYRSLSMPGGGIGPVKRMLRSLDLSKFGPAFAGLLQERDPALRNGVLELADIQGIILNDV